MLKSKKGMIVDVYNTLLYAFLVNYLPLDFKVKSIYGTQITKNVISTE